MLERLRIANFKSLGEVEVALAPLVVVLGPNAAGKSNFLEALLLLSKIGTERTLNDAFHDLRGYPAEAFGLPAGGLPELLEQATAGLEIEADIVPPARAKRMDPLRYRVRVAIEPRAGKLLIADEYLARLDRSRHPKGAARIEKLDDTPSEARLAVRQRGRAGAPRHEPLGLNYALVSDRRFDEERYPEFAAMRDELGAWSTYYLDPRVAMREAQPPSAVADIGTGGEHLAPFLYRLKSERRREFAAVFRALRSAIPGIEALDVDLDPQRGTLDILIRQGGQTFSSRVISEGTLRVLALCAIAANPWRSALVAFEEPENGVHPHRIDTIAHLVANMTRSGRHQVIVTTHSPRLAATIASFAQHPEMTDRVVMLQARQRAGRTAIEQFDPLPILASKEIDDALAEPTRAATFESVYSQGWLDG